jgi:hypothetical protein
MPARSSRQGSQPGKPRRKASRIIPAPAPAGKLPAWDVYKLAAKPKYVGRVQAKDEKEAVEKAIAEFGIPAHERFRIVARRD